MVAFITVIDGERSDWYTFHFLRSAINSTTAIIEYFSEKVTFESFFFCYFFESIFEEKII